MADEARLRQLLEEHMSRGIGLDLRNPYIAHAVERLSVEGTSLMETGRHDWVRRRAREMNDCGNWSGYAMEVHLAYALEEAGLPLRHGVMLMADSRSNVDFVYDHGAIAVRMECACASVEQVLWSNMVDLGDGVQAGSWSSTAETEVDSLRALQDKIRLKTTMDGITPTKFPQPEEDCVHVVVVDASKGLQWRPDRWDLELLSGGKHVVHPMARRDLLGLFEQSNEAETFDGEFARNRFVRDRIHAFLFLVDRSVWHGSLDPCYQGCILANPGLGMDHAQETALMAVAEGLDDLMDWIPPLVVVSD